MRKHFSSLRSQMLLLTTGTVLAVVILATVFYSSAQRMSEKKAATFVHSMLVQLGDSLDRIGNEMSYLGNALHSNEVLQQYYHAPTAIQRMQYGKSFIDFTSSLLNHSTTVSHIVIVNNDQSILSPTERNIIALDTLDSKYHLFESDNLSSGFYGPAFDTFTNINFFAYVQPVYNTRQGARFRQKLGTCVIFARLDLLQSTLRSALPTPGAALMLIEQDEQIILCCDADGNTLSLLPESFCSDMADGLQHSLTLNKTTYLTDSLLLSSMGWRLVSLVPEDEIAADLMPLLWLGMLICVVFAICIGVWNLHIQRSIMAPVKQLTAFIENDLDDKLQNRIHISTSSEMELFCQEINTLLDKVSEMTAERLQDQTRLYELNLAKKRAELSALQSQINPHFLYNTLDCIRGYGYMLNSSEIVSITNALSSIMRYCIKGADIVALDENAAQQLHPAVEQRNFSQLFLGEDAVGLIKAGQQQRDVIITAVVRHKDAGAILRDVVQSLDAEPDAGDVQDAFAPMGDVLFYQLAHRLGVACGQRTLGFAQHTVMDDHVPEQINE